MKKFNSRTYLYIAAAGLVFIIVLTAYFLLAPFSTSDEVQYVYIDSDDTQDSVFAKLDPIAGNVGMAGFCNIARHTSYGENIRTGRYAISPGENAITVFRHLRNGAQSAIRLTIPESRTMDRLAAILGQKLMLDSATFANALLSEEMCQHYGYDTATVSAMFVPNTYEVYWNVSLDNFLERMQKEHDRFWEGKREAKAAEMQLTPIEVCTLASIIDEETANNAEKPIIAGMYLNRLAKNMPLQADPTIKFALKQFELKRIWQKLLQTDSPYNTYIHEGLPPGPIKIASIQGIDAVLDHATHDYIYMCAKEDFSGTHNFASNYKEHLLNAAKYTKALNERGIK
ncbi:MAG: endolytic transglycosylase MltG [Prevotella sp.]|nr:endolytic transglycosylase MltG [Prevotella sp.]MBR3079185.1 endolytic transglycosylase MltG [Prevotella sp.]